jgi:hypothetical protein
MLEPLQSVRDAVDHALDGCSLLAELRWLLALRDALDYLVGILLVVEEQNEVPSGDVKARVEQAHAEFAAFVGSCPLAIAEPLRARIAALAEGLRAEMSLLLETSAFKSGNASLAQNTGQDSGYARVSGPGATGTIEGSDAVSLGASAPAAVSAGDEFLARFVAYPQGEDKLARELLDEGGGKRVELSRKSCRLARGTRVQVVLQSSHFTVESRGDACTKEFVWDGKAESLEFAVAVPQDVAVSQSLLRFSLLISDLPLAAINLEVRIGQPQAGSQVQQVGVSLPRRAFASYASRDRLRVLDRVDAMRISAGMDVFVDCLDLYAGKRWKPRLEKEIRERELFVLFWSSTAAQSLWVTWEWEQALLKGDPEEHMQIQPLEHGVRPPRGLEEIHVGSPLMAVRAAEEILARKKARAARKQGQAAS